MRYGCFSTKSVEKMKKDKPIFVEKRPLHRF